MLSFEGTSRGNEVYWPCRCDCGVERLVASKNLRSGTSQSCGCLRLEKLREKLTTHGLSRTLEYRRYYNLKNWDRYLLTKAKASTKRLGLPPCDLDRSDVQVPSHCPVLGIPLAPSQRGRTDNTPTLDRIIPERGYTKGNVVVVSWRANRLKLDASLAEIAALYRFYIEGAPAPAPRSPPGASPSVSRTNSGASGSSYGSLMPVKQGIWPASARRLEALRVALDQHVERAANVDLEAVGRDRRAHSAAR